MRKKKQEAIFSHPPWNKCGTVKNW